MKNDLLYYEQTIRPVQVSVLAAGWQDSPILIVAMDKAGLPMGYKIIEHPGNTEVLLAAGTARLFSFVDLNSNLEYDPGEPAGDAAITASSSKNYILALDAPYSGSAPLGSLYKVKDQNISGVQISLGDVRTLDAALFDRQVADLGMWQPTRFMLNGYGGIYFSEPYSRKKTPVLFIHGINGSPRDFVALADKLDHSRYQPWFLYYPSGLDIQTVANGSLGIINKLSELHHFKKMHLVAHSMGGLVVRAMLNQCKVENGCRHFASFSSISSPFGGVQAAENGVKYSPVVMPAWRSLDPESDFIRDLFTPALPQGLEHHLFFGFRKTGRDATSSDGTIALASQLRLAAQSSAHSVRGYNEDHVSILANDDLARQLMLIFEQDN